MTSRDEVSSRDLDFGPEDFGGEDYPSDGPLPETSKERALRLAHEKRMRKHLAKNSRYAQRDGDEIEAERKRYRFNQAVKVEAKQALRQGDLTPSQVETLRTHGLV